MKRIVLLSALLLAACNRMEQPVTNNAAEAANAGGPAVAAHLPDAAPLPAGGMAEWLTGAWSFEKECASDFVVHYNADGTLENWVGGGRWAFADGKVTETITEKFDMGAEASEKVSPPEVHSYPVERVDQNHGVATSPYTGKKVPILRC